MKSPEKFRNIYMSETSPDNPFGPNYYSLPYETKIVYKFSRMKDYVRATREDLILKEDEESKLIGSIMIGFSAGVALGGLAMMIFKRARPSLHQALMHYERVYYPVLGTITGFYAYVKADRWYFEEIQKKFLHKYLHQAIENGFEDYEISK